MIRTLPATWTLPQSMRFPLRVVGVAALTVGFAVMAAALTSIGRPWAWLALLALPFALRPGRTGLAAIGAASMLLRLSYIGTATDDQILVTQAALGRVLHGLSPYGVGYAESIPSGSPFPYGPLALLWWIPGPAIELAAAAGIMALLIHYRSWLALAAFCAFPPFTYLNATGVNDYSPALLIGLGLVVLPRWQGGVLLAMAAALKPYAFAWFLPAVGAGGMAMFAALALASSLLWAPALVWGGYLESIRMVDAGHGSSMLRYLAAPVSALGMLWRYPAIIGSAAAALLMLTSSWWSIGYLIPIVVALGLAQHAAPDTVVVAGRGDREEASVDERYAAAAR